MRDLVVFPARAFLVVEERLKEHQASSIRLPDEMPLDELALRVLIAAALAKGGMTDGLEERP